MLPRDTSDLCRICLANGAHIPIFETSSNNIYKDVHQMLNQCVREKVQDMAGYPRNICENCYILLDKIIDFLNKYQESYKYFMENISVNIKEECEHLYEEELYEEVTVKEEVQVKPELDIKYSIKDSRISFDDAKQFETLIKPLIKNNTQIKDENETIPNNQCKSKTFKLRNKPKLNAVKKSKPACNITRKLSKLPNKNKETAPKKKDASDQKDILEEKKNKTEKEKKVKSCLCYHCGLTFQKPQTLSNHINSHLNQVPKCDTCSKTFTSKGGLKKHMRVMHASELDKKYKCTECDKSFVLQHHLKIHYREKHSPEHVKKKAKCKFCDKLYCNRQAVLMHERSVHTGERPEICRVCDARFTHSSFLKEHMRLHTGETPFKCPVCGKGHAQHSNMKSHVKHNHKLSHLSEEQLKTIHSRYLKIMQP